MKLKICTTSQMFGYCLKAIRDTIFQYVVCNQGSGRVKHEGQGKDSMFW